MAVQTILPTNNLTYDDIRDTLNSAGGTVTNDVSTAFQTSANINMWAKYKPVTLSSDFANIGTEWWKGDDKSCNVSIPIFQLQNVTGTIDQFFAKFDSGQLTYRYKLVSNNKYRLGDFAGYYKDANHNIVQLSVPEQIKDNLGSSIAVQWTFNDNSLRLDDIAVVDGVGGTTYIKNWYLGVAVKWNSTNTYGILTDTVPCDMNGNVSTFRIEKIKGGLDRFGQTAEVIPILSEFTSNGEFVNMLGGRITPLPTMTKYSIQSVKSVWANVSCDNAVLIPYGGTYQVKFNINWSNASQIPSYLSGTVRIAACTSVGQPLGAFVNFADFNTQISTVNGSYSYIDTFSNSSLQGFTDANCYGVLVSITFSQNTSPTSLNIKIPK